MSLPVSFIVINRNVDLSIVERSIKALNNLGYSNKEIILVDDKSDYELPDSLTMLTHECVRNRERRGIGISRSIGYGLSKGELVFFIDSDIEVKHIDVADIVSTFSRFDRLIALSGDYYSAAVNDWNNVLDLRRRLVYQKNKRSYIYSNDASYTTFSGGFCVICKRKVSRFRQKWNNHMTGEDLIFQLSLLNEGFLFGYYSEMVGVHHHERSWKAAAIKLVKEARGDSFLTYSALKNDFKLPPLEGLTAFPIFLLLAIITATPELLLIEFSILLILAIVEHSLISVKLLLYQAVLAVVRIPFDILHILRGRLPISKRVEYVLFVSYSSSLAKIRWVRNMLSGTKRAYIIPVRPSAISLRLPQKMRERS